MKTAGQPPADLTAANTLGSLREAESLFRSKSIHEIRTVEASTRLDIEQKKEELRQLVGKSYRDLIDSADSIIQMKSSCESIASNLSRIDAALRLLSPSSTESPHIAPDPARRAKIYGIACRVKYLVDTPENIWGCLDESMLLEASGRYLRAKEVHGLLSKTSATPDVLSRFPLLQHQWQIVESFKAQISQRSRDRLMDRGLSVAAYADALAAAATIDDLNPKQVLDVFLDSRRAWISQKLVGTAAADDGPDSSLAVLCDVVKVIRASLGQVGQLLRHALSEMPLFYKLVLGSPPGSQLFGGIPNPEDEVKLWKLHREKLESVMVLLEPEFISQACSSWLESCCDEIFAKSISGKGLIRSILSGEGLVAAEKMVREALDARDGLEISLEEWLRDVFGSDINSPWKQICGLILKDGKDILEDRMEQAFLLRMKEIVQSGFEDLTKVVSIKGSIEAIVAGPNGANDFYEYLKISSKGGGVWFSELSQKRMGLAYNLKPSADENDFRTCLNAFFGPEVCRIRDLIDNKLWSILDDLLCFVESHNSTLRLKELAPHIQDKCYNSMSAFLEEIHGEMNAPSVSLINNRTDNQFQPSPVIVERSLFLARLLYALRNHSSHISLILGSPRQWAKETIVTTYASLASPLSKQYKGTLNSPQPFSPRRPAYDILPSPGRQSLETSKRQAFSAAAALLTVDNCTNLKHEKLSRNLQNLCIKAHNLWISWVSNELSIILSKNLNHDNALSVTNPLRGWEVTVIKQEEPAEGHLEMQIVLPSMASQYIISFLFQACQEIHKAGGHILNKVILQNFASEMLKKVIGVYENFLALVEAPESRVSEKGVLQILFDLRFSADVLSGGNDTNSKPLLSLNSNLMEICSGLIHRFSLKLDPIDWATYEPYLWENEKQSYKRCSVLFGFFIQLNRLYIDTVQKLPTKTNTESNILRCSAVPRFKYLPISAPALSSRGSHKSAAQMSMDDASTKTPWKAYSNGEQSPKLDFDDSSSFGAAAPLLKSFMTQVGSKFGESTSKWGMMLSDGKLKDRSAAAMSTFGDMLPGPAAGLLSSLTSGSRFDSL